MDQQSPTMTLLSTLGFSSAREGTDIDRANARFWKDALSWKKGNDVFGYCKYPRENEGGVTFAIDKDGIFYRLEAEDKIDLTSHGFNDTSERFQVVMDSLGEDRSKFN